MATTTFVDLLRDNIVENIAKPYLHAFERHTLGLTCRHLCSMLHASDPILLDDACRYDPGKVLFARLGRYLQRWLPREDPGLLQPGKDRYSMAHDRLLKALGRAGWSLEAMQTLSRESCQQVCGSLLPDYYEYIVGRAQYLEQHSLTASDEEFHALITLTRDGVSFTGWMKRVCVGREYELLPMLLNHGHLLHRVAHKCEHFYCQELAFYVLPRTKECYEWAWKTIATYEGATQWEEHFVMCILCLDRINGCECVENRHLLGELDEDLLDIVFKYMSRAGKLHFLTLLGEKRIAITSMGPDYFHPHAVVMKCLRPWIQLKLDELSNDNPG